LLAQRKDTSAYYIHRILHDNARLRKDTVRAESEAKELIRLLPNDPYSYSVLINYYGGRHRWEAVIDISSMLIKRDISNFSVWRNRIVIFNNLKDTAGHNETIREFLPLLMRYLSKNESDTREHVQAGYYFALLGKRNEAMAELKKALVYEDKWGEDEYFNSACVYAILGEWADAIDKLAHSIVIYPNDINDMKGDADLQALLMRPHAEAQIRARVAELTKPGQ
jgi:tetratricopeptide (TPR) repeat protein